MTPAPFHRTCITEPVELVDVPELLDPVDDVDVVPVVEPPLTTLNALTQTQLLAAAAFCWPVTVIVIV